MFNFIGEQRGYPSAHELPEYESPDSDGMADTYEVYMWGDLSKTAIGDENADGYDNIEGYFEWIVNGATFDNTTISATGAPVTISASGAPATLY